MKKMRFTLGLMLSMLFLGASVSNAQSYDVNVAVKGCSVYTGVTFELVISDPPSTNGYTLPLAEIQKEGAWVKGTDNGSALLGWDYPTLQGLYANYLARAYNLIEINLAYVLGNDLNPVVKRTITIADSHVTIISFLKADEAWLRPHMDRMTSVARYTYKDQMLPLLDKYPIESIYYEISIHDEFDSPGSNDYEPPTGADVTTLRAIEIFAEDGITTNPSTLGAIRYVPSQKPFTFTAVSAKPITVFVESAYPNVDLPAGLVDCEYIGSNTYKVTIKRVEQNLNIYVTATTSTSGDGDGEQTGNLLVAKNNVWAASGTLFVETDSPATLSVYSVTGQLVNQVSVSGSTSLPLPKGLYIVQLNGKAYKVIN